MNIRELDEESRRTGVWPPRRIILRVERGSSHVEEPESEAPVSVGLVDLASPARPTVRAAPRAKPAAAAPEVLAAGQVAPRPPLSRPPAPGSVVRRNGRIVAMPRPASTVSDADAEFEKWLAMPLAITQSDPDYQPPPVWLPEDRRLRAERRHRRIARRTRSQLVGMSAVTLLAAAGCSAALAVVLSQTETVGGKIDAPTIGLFGTRPTAPAPPPAQLAPPPVKPVKPAADKPPATKKPATKRTRRATRSPATSSTRANQDASAPAQSSAPARSGSSTPPRQAAVAPPPPPPPAAAPRTSVAKPKAPTVQKTPSPKPVPAPPASSSPSGSGSPSLGGDGEPSLGPG